MATEEVRPDVAPGETVETGPKYAPADMRAPLNVRREMAADVSPVAPAARAGSAAQIIIAVVALLAVCYFAKLVLVTLFSSVLLAFVLAPIADQLERVYLPRWIAALVAVVLALALLYALVYVSYASAINFMAELPKYSGQMRQTLLKFRKQAQELQKQTSQVTDSMLPADPEAKNTVTVEQRESWSSTLTRWAGSVTEFIFIVSFVPFLVYFMLTWQGHMRSATVMVFSMENRNTAYVTIGQISAMMRSFIIGNVVVGLFISVISVLFFWYLGVPFFYFMGFLSGFLSLVPYMGVVLAMIPPLAVGVGRLGGPELLAVSLFTVALHVFAINVLYPKILGKRLQLNPLVITVALLLWGWLWGAMGLILAVPLTAGMKIIFDHIDGLRPIGAWMGE